VSKTIVLPNEKELIETTKKLIEQMRVDPKSMPVCILCETNRSTTLLAYSPEGDCQTALFGVCDACKPNTDAELLDKVIEKVKERMETRENTVHLKRKEWIQ
jgi:hypothetical protein